MTWDQAYELHWKKLQPEQLRLWQEELSARLGNIGEDEISDAIRAYDESTRKAGVKEFRPPHPRDVITLVIRARWERAQANAPPPEHCALCGGNGWMKFRAQRNERGTVVAVQVADMPGDNNTVCPCVCSAGQKVRRDGAKHGKNHDTLDRLQGMVMDAMRGQVASNGLPHAIRC